MHLLCPVFLSREQLLYRNDKDTLYPSITLHTFSLSNRPSFSYIIIILTRVLEYKLWDTCFCLIKKKKKETKNDKVYSGRF